MTVRTISREGQGKDRATLPWDPFSAASIASCSIFRSACACLSYFFNGRDLLAKLGGHSVSQGTRKPPISPKDMNRKKEQIKSITEIKGSTDPQIQNTKILSLTKKKQIEALNAPPPDLKSVWGKSGLDLQNHGYNPF